MASRAEPLLSEAYAGALDWWREAGVDCAFSDEPQGWIAPESPEAEPPALAPETPVSQPAAERGPAERVGAAPPLPEMDRTSWPTDLSGFARWWMEDAWLDEGRVHRRVPPRGAAEPKLMIIVPEPEREDRENLLSGRDGALLSAMLSAMDLGPDQVYFASALPRHMPGADWGQIAARGMGEVLAHHIALVRPQRLAIFGANILPLAGNAPPQGPADLRIFNHEGSSLPLLAARSLAALHDHPRAKAMVWRAWLDWTG